MPPIDPSEVPDLIKDAEDCWGRQAVARALDVSDKSLSNWRRGKGLGGIRPDNLDKLADLKKLFVSGGTTPPPLAALSRIGRQAARLTEAGATYEQQSASAEALAIVKTFYEAIDGHQFPKAWSCLSRAFQERRWKRGVAEFEAGYAGFGSIENLVIAPLSPVSASQCRVLVYYEEVTEIIDIPEASRWRSTTLGDVLECARTLDEVRSLLASAGSNAEISSTALSRLFSEMCGNILHASSRLTKQQFLDTIKGASVQTASIAMPVIAVTRRQPAGTLLIDSILPVTWASKTPGR